MKQSEFDEHFPKTFTMVNWGALQIAQRNRFLNCPEDLHGCHQAWGDLRYPNEVFNNYTFSLSPNWVDGNREYPLKILSPEYFSKTGSYFRQGYGQFSCRFVDDPNENIECKLEDRTLLYPVFGRIDNSDFSKQPTRVMKGLLTNECFRIKVRSTYSNWTDTDVDTGNETHISSELETVFYVRAKKGTFLNPQ